MIDFDLLSHDLNFHAKSSCGIWSTLPMPFQCGQRKINEMLLSMMTTKWGESRAGLLETEESVLCKELLEDAVGHKLEV
jgi:hypothetical protein